MLKLAGIFKDHMVLQRDRYVPVWGKAEPGAQVRVTLQGCERTALTGADGGWAVELPPLSAGGPYRLDVRCGGEEIALNDVLVGDVWLAGGQSNMEMRLIECEDGPAEVARSAHPRLRFYKVPRLAVVDETLAEQEAACPWQVCGPETTGELSGAAYYFAREIAERENVAVGIIDCSWGGTSVSCWMSEKTLSASVAGQRYIDDYAALIGSRSEEQYRAAMADYERDLQAWQARVDALREEVPGVGWPEIHRRCGECPWPQPAGNASPFKPANLYHAMIERVRPYGLRGFLYYQGEEDVARCFDYAAMMTTLIDQWRTDWRDDTLPFLFVQLPMFINIADHAAGRDDRHWAELRDQQRKVSRTVANAAMAVLADCGELDNIHPLDKRTVGHRLALLARERVYGEKAAAVHAPEFLHAEPLGEAMEVRFTADDGPLTLRGDAPEGFELAGEDGAFCPATGEALADRLILRAKGVAAPRYVRYAWANFCAANLYGISGWPVAPFRTDAFPID